MKDQASDSSPVFPDLGALKKKIAKLIILVFVLLGAMFFLPAWTFNYWQAWVYLAVIAIPMGSIVRYLYKHDPALLERRAAIPALLIVPFLMFRIKHEEAQMLAELEGYREYTQKVRCRLFPGIW